MPIEPVRVTVKFDPDAGVQFMVVPEKARVPANAITEVRWNLVAPAGYTFAPHDGLSWNSGGPGRLESVNGTEWMVLDDNTHFHNAPESFHYTITVQDPSGNRHFKDDPEVENDPTGHPGPPERPHGHGRTTV